MSRSDHWECSRGRRRKAKSQAAGQNDLIQGLIEASVSQRKTHTATSRRVESAWLVGWRALLVSALLRRTGQMHDLGWIKQMDQ